MMIFLAALHTIAARRGDGLRPELIRLLADSKVERASTALGNCEDRCMARSGSDLASPDNKALHESVLRRPTNPK